MAVRSPAGTALRLEANLSMFAARRWPGVWLTLAMALLPRLPACGDPPPGNRAAWLRQMGQDPHAKVQKPPTPSELPVEQGGIGWTRAVRALKGAHLTVQADYESGTGDRSAHLQSLYELEERADGDFHVRVVSQFETPEGQKGRRSREGFWIAGRLYTQIDQYPFQARDGLSGVEQPWRAAATEIVPFFQSLLGPLVRWQAAGTNRIDNRVVSIFHATQTPSGGGRPANLATLRDQLDTWPAWWRGTYRLTAVTGQRSIVASDGYLSDFQLRLDAVSEGLNPSVVLHVTVAASIREREPTAAAWQPPPGAEDPARPREILRMRRILAPFIPNPAEPEPEAP